MKGRNTITPKNKTTVLIKRVVIFTVAIGGLSGLFWKFFIGTAATVATQIKVSAQMTPGTGPQISGHTWEGTITVDHNQVVGNSDLIDFPLLVELTHSNLRGVAHGGFVESTEGFDILFAGANDSKLDHEIESYDPSSGSIVAWVKLPVLYTAQNTQLKITAGNPALTTDPSTPNVWGSQIEAVWHMSEDPSTTPLKDTKGSFHANSNGEMTSGDLVNGKIGQAIDFDGVNDFFSIESKNFNSYGEITSMAVSAWVQTTYDHSSWTANWSLLDFDRSEYFNFFVHGKGKISFCSRDADGGINDFHAGVDGQVNDGNWHYVTAVFDGTDKKLYIDGVLLASQASGSTIGTGLTRFGFIGDGSEASNYNGSRNNKYYKGKIDELRLYKRFLTDGWIATEYNNQSSPKSFATFGNPTNLPIELTSFNAKLDGDQVNVLWDVATQRDNDYFTIERSVDGKNFDPIGKIDGAGTTQKPMEYEFIDYEPEAGLNYYRLRQTDYNGAFEIFHVVAVNHRSSASIDNVALDVVRPNPFSDKFTIDYTVQEDTEIQIVLMNSGGASVFQDVQYAYSGQNSYECYGGVDVPAGLYFVNLVQNGETLATTKVMKR